MKPIQVVVMLALAGLTASAFAGPDWEAINRARQSSAQVHSAAVDMAANQQSMGKDCEQMMEHMPAGMANHGAMAAANRSASTLFGEPARNADATRAVIVQPGVKAIPVVSGETVRFDFGAKTAAWHFAPQSGGEAVDLGLLLPEIPSAQGVWVYPRADRTNAGQ
jgi:hypothetical protein